MKRLTHMHRYILTASAIALGLTALAGTSGEKSKKHGTDILHLSIQKRMANSGVLADASGRVEIHWNEQGKANHQEINLKLKGLEAGAAYQLAALLNDDTNLTQ